MNARPQATLAAAATGVLVGAAMVATRTVSTDASPATLAFLRYFIGMCVLAVPMLLTRRTRFSVKDTAAIAVLGVFQFAVLIVLLNYALETLSAATCALIFSTMPLVTMCLAVGLRREVFSLARLTGLVLAVSGVGFLLHTSLAHVSAHADLSAIAALIGATVIGAVCSMLYRPYLRRYPALPTSALAMFTAVIFLGALCLATAQPLVPRLSAMQWANVVFIGLSSGVGYFCWLWALGKLEASRVVAFQALGPVTATVIELLLARQMPSWGLCLSVALVVGGLNVALRDGRRMRAVVRPG
ncbi:DMT family transporter [Paraburkholderia sp.]|uniref:DMT family transporter n=1 Tax=Paraburkholderia sp. TaxID=1926495 RepID=UPI002D278A33|nr:DMT family transporter [Paraburkholderia sp.]HZZ02254.1 DMT family transporter [Paraburkholderia sp.]